MRFTMLEPRATATATLDEPPARPRDEWHDPFKYGYEEIEASWSFRYSQIGFGITTYFLVSRGGAALVLVPLGLALRDKSVGTVVVVISLGWLLLSSLAALAGGAIAGCWARNWLAQGLGVAAGVFFVPLLFLLIFVPQSWPMFCISLAITSVLSVVGAFLGHLFVKPTRIPKH